MIIYNFSGEKSMQMYVWYWMMSFIYFLANFSPFYSENDLNNWAEVNNHIHFWYSPVRFKVEIGHKSRQIFAIRVDFIEDEIIANSLGFIKFRTYFMGYFGHPILKPCVFYGKF